MRIAYCPLCNRAGLRYDDKRGMDWQGLTSKDRYEAYIRGIVTRYGEKKWCPRCKQWVKPQITNWFRAGEFI